MSKHPRLWGKGLALGCGVLVLIPLVLAFVIAGRTCAPLGAAREAQTQLEERYGLPGSFTPVADGSLSTERIRVFLQVRHGLAETCQQFESIMGSIKTLEKLDGQNPSAEEIAAATGGLAQTAMGITPLLGKFFEARNRTLLDHGMGLGEYSYLFAVAYRQQLLDPLHLSSVFAEDRPLAPDATSTLLQILENQAREYHEIHQDRSLFDEEIAAMQDDPDRLLWQEGQPAPLAESLAPHRSELNAAFCGATAALDTNLSSIRAIVIALE